jgi:polyadenylate-binding protein
LSTYELVFVGLHIPRRERESKEEAIKQNFTNVFVKNLPESIDDAGFDELFRQYGDITSSALAKDADGKSKCFGFVNFADHEAADNAVEELNGKEIDGKSLFVGRAQKKSEREEELRKKFEQMRLERLNKYQGVNLYIKNLDETIDDERLRQEFSVYGTITSARVMHDDKNISKGFAFVCFSSPEEATKAVTEMNNKIVGAKPIYVALAQRRDVRRAMLEAQYSARNQLRQQAAGMIPMYGAPMMYPGQPNMSGQVPPQAGFMYPGQLPVRPGVPYPGMPQPFPGGMPAGARMPRPGPGQPRGPRPMGPRPGQPNAMMYPPTMQAGGPGARPPVRPGFKYNSNVRNPSAQSTGPVASTPNQPPQLTAAMLAKLDPSQQRQIIGERLFPLVVSNSLVAVKHKEHAGKITGMLLEMEVSELLHLLEAPEALTTKLEEAVAVLEQYLAQQQA